MSPTYRGKALQARAPRRRRLGRRIALALAVIGVITLLAHVPWGALRRRWVVVSEVRVEGARYLDPSRVRSIAGIGIGDDLLDLKLDRVRQSLLLDSRIAGAEVARRFPRGVRIRVEERLPALLVHHGIPWEIDASGVLLAPLERGVVADVPLLVGPNFEGVPAGTQVGSSAVARGLQWALALSAQALQLAGQVSELDVSRDELTTLTLLDGTRVIAPAWPPSTRVLSALRVVLADLKQKGATADEVDVRFENQVIVRPAGFPQAEGRQG
jgi:cell division septal protein FtsQ